MPDINPVLRAASELQGTSQRAGEQLVDIYGALGGLSQDDANVNIATGLNLQIIQGAKDAAELQTQEIKLRKANELGIDPKARNDVLTSLAETIASAYQEKEAALSDIKKKQSADLLTDPAGWLMAQFTINKDIKRHNNAETQLDSATAQYDKLNKLVQSSNLTHTQLQENMTAAVAAANKDNIANQAKISAHAALKQGLIYNAQGINAILNARSIELTAAQSVFGSEMQQANFNLALENAARAREEFEWRKQAKEQLDASDNLIIEKINAGMSLRLGGDAKLLRAGTAEANNAIALLKSGNPVGKQIQDDYLRGEQGILAASPSQALDAIKTQGVKMSPAQYPVRTLLETALQQVQQLPGFDPKNKAAVTAAIDQTTRAIIDGQLRKINPDDSANVFNIPALSQVIKNVPELQSLPVVQKVLAERAKAGDNLSRPNDVFQAVAEGVKSGKITYAEAMDLPLLYQRAVGVNLAARNLENFGISPSKELSKYGYRTEITTDTRVFAPKEVIDLTKVDVYGRALNVWLSHQHVADVQKRLGEGALRGMRGPGAISMGITEGMQNNKTPEGDFYPNFFSSEGWMGKGQ